MTYFVKTKVELKFGQNAGFAEVLAKLVPFLKPHGWELRYGLQALVGDLTEILHLWEVKNFEDIAKGLNAAFSDPKLGASLATLPNLMVKETMQIMVKTPYSP